MDYPICQRPRMRKIESLEMRSWKLHIGATYGVDIKCDHFCSFVNVYGRTVTTEEALKWT